MGSHLGNSSTCAISSEALSCGPVNVNQILVSRLIRSRGTGIWLYELIEEIDPFWVLADKPHSVVMKKLIAACNAMSNDAEIVGYSSSILRKQLLDIWGKADPAHENPYFNQAVLIGHSMGGISLF
jgi:hypothetical protein